MEEQMPNPPRGMGQVGDAYPRPAIESIDLWTKEAERWKEESSDPFRGEGSQIIPKTKSSITYGRRWTPVPVSGSSSLGVPLL